MFMFRIDIGFHVKKKNGVKKLNLFANNNKIIMH